MKHPTKTILLLIFVFVCFISMSAISGEDPWDANQSYSQSSGNSNSSSTGNVSENIVQVSYIDSPLNMLFDISLRFLMWRSDGQMRTEKFSRELEQGNRIR